MNKTLKEREKNESVINTVLALLSVWAFFSAITDGVASVDWLFFDENLYTNPLYGIVSGSVAALVTIIGIIAIICNYCEKEKISILCS